MGIGTVQAMLRSLMLLGPSNVWGESFVLFGLSFAYVQFAPGPPVGYEEEAAALAIPAVAPIPIIPETHSNDRIDIARKR